MATTTTGGGRQRGGRTRSRTGGAEKTTSTQQRGDGPTVHLPFVTAQFHAPHLRMPDQKDLTSAADAVRERLPSRDQALFYGALAAGAAFSLIEWPVALAIGAGNALVQRHLHEQQHSGPA
ncbi:hypothetical protein GCM10025787_09980 [Saccharopolyspora rosea]